MPNVILTSCRRRRGKMPPLIDDPNILPVSGLQWSGDDLSPYVSPMGLV